LTRNQKIYSTIEIWPTFTLPKKEVYTIPETPQAQCSAHF